MQLILLIFGVASIFASDLFDIILTAAESPLGMSILKSLDLKLSEAGEYLTNLKEFMTGVGVFGIIAGIVVLVGMFICCCHYGQKMVWKFLLLTISIIELAVGIIVILVAVLLLIPALDGVKSDVTTSTVVVAIVLGSVMAVVGILGIFATTCCTTCCARCIFCIFLIFNIFVLIFLAVIIVLGIVIVAVGPSGTDGMCKENSSFSKAVDANCTQLGISYTDTKHCAVEYDQCQDDILTECIVLNACRLLHTTSDKKVQKIWSNGISSFGGILLFAGIYLFIFFLIGIILACAACCCGKGVHSQDGGEY